DYFKGNVRNYSNSFASVLTSGKPVTEATGREISIEGLPLKVGPFNTFVKLASKWGELVEWKNIEDNNFSRKQLYVKTKLNEIICERFKVIIQGNVHWVRAKEMERWDPLLQTSVNEVHEKEIEAPSEEAKQNSYNSVRNNSLNASYCSQRFKAGLDHKTKKGWIKDLCTKNRVNFVSLQETKMKHTELVTINKLWGNSSYDYAFSSSLVVTGTWIPTWYGECVIMGDFNEVRSEHERYGSVFNVQSVAAFINFISLASLIDLPLDGYAYTWVHKSATKMSKLDRFLISKGLMASFPHLSAICLDKHLSDHHPILMREMNIYYGPTPFRFFHSWFQIEGFYKLVEDTWMHMDITYSNGMILLKKKLQALKIIIREWTKNAKKCSYKKKSSIQSKLSYIDKIIDQGGSIEEMAQKEKVRWAIEGNENSKYFHGILNKKRSHLAIRGVLVNGDWIVKPNDSTFISNRQILDGPFILNELLSWCKYKKLKDMVFKIDFEKAFDSIRWDYLDDVLKSFGFRDKWRGWISGCLKSAKGYVLVNGSPTLEFQFHRGLKQGDPLSPFLFILIMESLHLSFKKVMNAGLFTGIPLDNSLTIYHLFYADDAIFVRNWDSSNLKFILKVLKCFHMASGLKININKSKLMGYDVHSDEVGGRMERINSWDDVVSKVTSRLSKWKLKVLSRGVLASKYGGLGISSFFAMNRALLSKWVWRFLSETSSLWTRTIKAIHGEKGNLEAHGNITRRSPCLDIVREINVLRSKGIDFLSLIRKKVGNGENTLFWKDSWFDGISLKQQFPCLYSLESAKHINVAKKMNHPSLSWSYRREPRGGIEEEQQNMLFSRISGVILPNMRDCWTGRLKLREIFRLLQPVTLLTIMFCQKGMFN
nr:RNA-directed DNA polymerase, eukaryota, reverse transcriptase zinc-binding domain protein [Tanacetum cinerariifolium]